MPRRDSGDSGTWWRCAAATAPGCTAGAGWVPAEVAGTGLVSFHSAAASCERAELCVQTNTTRTASCTLVGRNASKAPGASVT